MREPITCDHCGEVASLETLTDWDGQQLCEACLEEETLSCSCCDARIHQDENAGTYSTPLCLACYNRDYTHCARCGRLLLREDAYYLSDCDAEPLCDDCYDVAFSKAAIHDYYYKPEPIFHGEGLRYFGVELEIDEGGEYPDVARSLLELVNQNAELLYCKHDGSLSEGFELVTHPMSLDFHIERMPWATLLRQVVSLGYRSHRTSTCGLHVHVNRDSFGETSTRQEACIARVLYFFEKHWEELLKFSRRSERQLERWAARYGYKEHPQDILDAAKKGYGGGRYSCVNLGNHDTIEFRIFRGTLKCNTLIATLQLLDRVCEVAILYSDEEIRNLSWTSFVAELSLPELIQYLKERRLYVNEPVESEEDV